MRPGQLINCRVDFVLANDVTAPLAIGQFRRLGVEKPFDAQRVAMVPSHFAPNKDIKSAENAKAMREFALEQGIVYYEVRGAPASSTFSCPTRGWVLPGDVVAVPILTPAPTAPWAASLPAWVRPISPRAMATGDIWMKVPQTIKIRLPRSGWSPG